MQPLDKPPSIHGSSTKPVLHNFEKEKQEEEDKIGKYACLYLEARELHPRTVEDHGTQAMGLSNG